MANFVCDICGGAIKMQANKTGVCQGCGMEYDIEAIRAMAGQKNNIAASATPVQTASIVRTSDNDLDREALLIYLLNLRSLETLIYENKKNETAISSSRASNNRYISSIQQQLADIKTRINQLTPPTKESCKPNNESQLTSYGKGLLILGLMFLFMGLLPFDGAFILGLGFYLCVAIIGLPLFVIGKAKDNSSTEQLYNIEKINYEERKKSNERNLQKTEKEYKQAEEAKKEWESIAVQHEKDIAQSTSETTMILEKAYNANIIPAQFRTIEGVYYLYDYLSTSNQSLSEALMQANLEAIKQKLDDMIKLQSAQIIQQAQTNAKLDDIQDTNNRILATAQQNARNSSLAAKYAEITAVNTEVIAQLSKKQLAYQRADFWLNSFI